MSNVSKVYGFIDVTSITAVKFSVNIIPVLERILEDPNAQILFSDLSGGNIYISRYLREYYYRNAVLYHIGEKPRINLANLPMKGGFNTAKEVINALFRDADEIIQM